MDACIICGKSTVGDLTYDDRALFIPNTLKYIYVCMSCVINNFDSTIIQIIMDAKNADNMQYKCMYCKSKFSWYNDHVSVLITSNNKFYKFSICHFCYKENINL